MRKKLAFDPIDEAARQWGLRWGALDQMHAVTSLMRVQQLVLADLDDLLRPHGLSFARYEALVLLTRGYGAACHAGLEAATTDLVGARFALADVPVEDLQALSTLLRPVREAAGDF